MSSNCKYYNCSGQHDWRRFKTSPTSLNGPWRPGTNNLFLFIPTFNPQCSYQIKGFVCGDLWTRNRPRSPGNRDEYYSTLYLAYMPLTILFICYDHVYVMVICNDKWNKSLFCFSNSLPVKHPASRRVCRLVEAYSRAFWQLKSWSKMPNIYNFESLFGYAFRICYFRECKNYFLFYHWV